MGQQKKLLRMAPGAFAQDNTLGALVSSCIVSVIAKPSFNCLSCSRVAWTVKILNVRVNQDHVDLVIYLRSTFGQFISETLKYAVHSRRADVLSSGCKLSKNLLLDTSE